jgi:hypothetical protein
MSPLADPANDAVPPDKQFSCRIRVLASVSVAEQQALAPDDDQ